MDAQDLIVARLNEIHTDMKNGFKSMESRLDSTDMTVAVLKDRSNRAEKSAGEAAHSAGGARLWGKGGVVAALIAFAPHFRDLAKTLVALFLPHITQ
jgi:hypothetical protein